MDIYCNIVNKYQFPRSIKFEIFFEIDFEACNGLQVTYFFYVLDTLSDIQQFGNRFISV